jgi:hypothetical protein
VADPVPFTYRAFLSYSHRDHSWAAWLHRALERTKVDKELVGRKTPVGSVPPTLRPVFRDRDDFAAGSSLTAQTLTALRSSEFLVAICSPNAARSVYVNEEIRCFKALGRAERIIPLIVNGEPGDPENECFPPSLRFKLNEDGSVGTQAEEPIAADARPQGDGKQAALLKVTAGLLGVPLDEVIRRAHRARKRQRAVWGAIAGAFLMLLAGGSVAFAGVITSHWKATTGWMKSCGSHPASSPTQPTCPSASEFRSDVPLALLTRADAALTSYISKGKDSPKLRQRRALTLLSLAGNYAKLGDSGAQSERAREAVGLLEKLVAENSQNALWRQNLASV